MSELKSNIFIQEINQGKFLAWIDPLGSNCLGSTTQGHLGFGHPRHLCWWCVFGQLNKAPFAAAAGSGLHPAAGICASAGYQVKRAESRENAGPDTYCTTPLDMLLYGM